jgi:hypothetical protein
MEKKVDEKKIDSVEQNGISNLSDQAGGSNENSDYKNVRYYESNSNSNKVRDKWYYIRIALIIGAIVVAIPLLLFGTCMFMFAGGF